jgi:hypothetical protein
MVGLGGLLLLLIFLASGAAGSLLVLSRFRQPPPNQSTSEQWIELWRRLLTLVGGFLGGMFISIVIVFGTLDFLSD